jgi:dipeptidyl aminopeptidase/acylaminoacyl peptidase
MTHFNARAAVAVLCLLAPLAAVAADLVPVEDFARHPTLMSPRLSPDGKYLAVRMDDPGSDMHALAIYAVADMTTPVSMLRMPKYELPEDIRWASPTRLVVEKGKQLGSIDKPYATGEIIATDVDGKNQDYLYGYESVGRRSSTRSKDRGWASIDGTPERANGHFYMGTQSWEDDNTSSLYDVDAVSSARRLVGNIGVGGMTFMVGADGAAHYAYGTDEDFKYVIYHREGSGWNKLALPNAGGRLAPLTFTPDHQNVYATYSPEGGPSALVEQDEAGGNRKVLAKDDFGSIGDLMWTALPEQPFAAIASTGVPKVIYTDPNLPAAKLHMAISQKFPGKFIDFINFSEDGGQLLFSAMSDRDPGTYYLIDTKTYKVRTLFAGAPWIDPAKMAERRPLRFKTSDGHELEAILTIPPGSKETNLPMVLLPHGGPHGVQDDWFFDDDAQFLANRGYLVLQVNYRGSSGRGHNFEAAGYLQWGERIQQDLIDGVKWAIADGYADAKRICVYGGSFGGYSAMMTVIRAPGMFKCAIGYAGVYDLDMMYNKGDVRTRKSGRSYLTTVIGKDQTSLDANSPDKLADKIDVPVLLVHGEDDQRAPFAQAKAMRAALEAAHKPYEWMAVSGEGHGFYKEENRVAFLNKLQSFLDAHIGKPEQVAAQP